MPSPMNLPLTENPPIRVFGLTGQPSAGKDTAAEFLVSRGYAHISAGDLIRQEMNKAGIPLDRPRMSEFAREAKKERGMGYLAELAVKAIKGNSVVSGVRTVLEVEILRKHFGKNFVLLAIDAPIRTRYERAFKRNRPGDNITFEQFQAQEEMERADPSGAQEVDKVIAVADKVIDNSDSMEILKKQLQEMVVNG